VQIGEQLTILFCQRPSRDEPSGLTEILEFVVLPHHAVEGIDYDPIDVSWYWGRLSAEPNQVNWTLELFPE
jgi:hypothetical protein